MHNKFESGKMYIYTCINNIKHSFPDFMYYFLILNLSALRICLGLFLPDPDFSDRIKGPNPDPDVST